MRARRGGAMHMGARKRRGGRQTLGARKKFNLGKFTGKVIKTGKQAYNMLPQSVRSQIESKVRSEIESKAKKEGEKILRRGKEYAIKKITQKGAGKRRRRKH